MNIGGGRFILSVLISAALSVGCSFVLSIGSFSMVGDIGAYRFFVMNMFESAFLCGGDLVSGDLIRLLESTDCQISSLSVKSSGDLWLVCDILVLTRINGDIGLLICFVAAVLVLGVGVITRTDKVSGVGWPWAGNDRYRSAVRIIW